MHLFRLPSRDLIPFVSLFFVFGMVGLGAVVALLSMPGPQLSLVSLLP